MRRYTMLIPLALAGLLSAGQASQPDPNGTQPGTKQNKPAKGKNRSKKARTAPNKGGADRNFPANQLPDRNQGQSPNAAPIPAPNDTVPNSRDPRTPPNPGNPKDPTSPTVVPK